MAMAAGKHKISHKSSKITVFLQWDILHYCKPNLFYLNLPQVFECLLSKNLIWIILSCCSYWILHPALSSKAHIAQCKEFQQEQRHQRAFLDKIENSSASGSGKVMEKLHLSVYLNQLWRADFSRILSGNSKWFLASWESYSFSDIQSRASYNPPRGKHPFNPI